MNPLNTKNTRKYRVWGYHRPMNSSVRWHVRKVWRRVGVVSLMASLLGPACSASPQLPIVRKYDTIPLTDGPNVLSMVGKCVVFEGPQPVVTSCPIPLETFTTTPREAQSRKRSTFGHGVFRPTDPDIAATGLSIAYEFATYGDVTLQWSDDAKDDDIRSFATQCRPGRREYVVVREVIGCGFVASAQRSSAYWSIAELASDGAVIGAPEGFWSQAPMGGRATEDARCTQTRVVMVQLTSWTRLCERFKQQAKNIKPKKKPPAPKPPPEPAAPPPPKKGIESASL